MRQLAKRSLIYTAQVARTLQIYINHNLRTAARNDYEHHYFKLFKNVVFGKTMQNARNRWQLRLTVDIYRTLFLLSRPEFFTRRDYNNGLRVIATFNIKIIDDEPEYVGCYMLGISNMNMLGFHYSIIHKQVCDCGYTFLSIY